jgi:regulator of protease activity HflC (stomatin/prohibitin superfamily)
MVALTFAEAINQAAEPWGMTCLRCEIRDIMLPDKVSLPNTNALLLWVYIYSASYAAQVVEDMQRQVSAERKKRASILESEGSRESSINVAEGQKTSSILASEVRGTCGRCDINCAGATA